MKRLLLFFTIISYTCITLSSTSRLKKMRSAHFTAAVEAQARTNVLKNQTETNRQLKIKKALVKIQAEEAVARYQIEQEQLLPQTQTLKDISNRRNALLTEHRLLLRAYTNLCDPRYK